MLPRIDGELAGHVLLDAANWTEKAGSYSRAAALYAGAASAFPEFQELLLLKSAQVDLMHDAKTQEHLDMVRALTPRSILTEPIAQFADVQLDIFLKLYASSSELPPASLLKEAVLTRREPSCTALLTTYDAATLAKLAKLKPAPQDFDALVNTLHGHCEEHLEERSTIDALKIPVSASARTRRAHLLIGHVHFNATLEEIDRIKRADQSEKERCQTDFLKARATYRIRKTRSKAQALYENVASKCTSEASSLLRRKSLYAMGKRNFDTNKLDASAEHFRTLLLDYPKASHADDAILYLARIAREKGEVAREKELVALAIDNHPTGDMLFEIVWEHLEELVYTDAHQAFLDALAALKLPEHDEQYYSQGRLAYFKARALMNLGSKEDALTTWRETWLKYPFSFYGYLSYLRAVQGGIDQSKLALFPKTNPAADTQKPSEQGLPPITLGTEQDATLDAMHARLWPLSLPWLETPAGILARHDLFDFAARQEVAQQRAMSASSSPQTGESEEDDTEEGDEELSPSREALSSWRLAWLHHNAGHYHISHNIVRRQIPGRPWRFEDEVIQRRAWEIAWPMPYASPVEQAVTLENTQYRERDDETTRLLAAFPLSIMREESSFIEDIVSYAGALGLMQLMLATARDHDDDLDSNPVTKEELLTAKVNIRVGVDHLFALARRMNNHPVMMAAAYNAGAGAVRSWLKDPRSKEIGLWVEDIPYFQARNYSKRVLGSYIAYQWLLGHDSFDEVVANDATLE